jgi:photosystem II stability/assembly factor-like uncharacterized protein
VNDEMIDHLIDQVISETKGSDVKGPASLSGSHPGEEAGLIVALAELREIDWVDEEVGDRLVQHLLAQTGPRPARFGYRRHRAVVVMSVAALVVALTTVSLLWGSSSHGPGGAPSPGVATQGPVHLQMKFVDAVSSPFQMVGADPGAFYLQCITDATCYGTSGSYSDGGSPALYRTDDGGASWAATAALPDGLTAPLACTSATDCMAAVTEAPVPAHGALRSLPTATTTDGGAHWTRSSLALPVTLAGAQITDVTCATAQRCVVSVGVEEFPAGTTQPSVGTFFTTADGGVTWSQDVQVPSAVAANGLLTMHCAADGSCLGVTFVGSAGQPGAIGTVRSSDSGTTWTAAASTTVTFGGGEVAASCGDTSHCEMVGPSSSGTSIVIAATTDGGANWRVSPAPSGWGNDALSLSCATGTDCSVSTADAAASGYANPVIEATTDGGATWTPLRLPKVSGSSLGSIQPLSCPSVAGCIGVGALPGEPTSVLVSSLPASK